MANMCVNKDGYAAAEKIRFEAVSSAAAIKQTVAVAQFALSAADAVSNFRKLRNVTSRGIAIEEEQHGHLKNVYWPAEKQHLQEFTQATPWESQSVLARRYAGKLWAPLAAGFAREIQQLECNKPRYCGSAFTKAMQDLMVRRAATHANAKLLADRIAFYEIEAVRDTDFERRKQAIAMRQGLVQQAAALMATAQRGFSGAAGASMAQVNNAIQAFGYFNTQRQQANAGETAPDPYFHSQVSRNTSELMGPPISAMQPEIMGPPLSAAPDYMMGPPISAMQDTSSFIQYSQPQVDMRPPQRLEQTYELQHYAPQEDPAGGLL